MDHAPRFLALVDAAKREIVEVTVEEVRRRQQAGERLRLIDVREDNEWQAGRAAQAEHLGKGIIERDIERACPDLDEELVLYCGGGFRSALAARTLREMGYRNVKSMAGGWKAWLASGFPTEK